jgi:hypothetical protein
VRPSFSPSGTTTAFPDAAAARMAPCVPEPPTRAPPARITSSAPHHSHTDPRQAHARSEGEEGVAGSLRVKKGPVRRKTRLPSSPPVSRGALTAPPSAAPDTANAISPPQPDRIELTSQCLNPATARAKSGSALGDCRATIRRRGCCLYSTARRAVRGVSVHASAAVRGPGRGGVADGCMRGGVHGRSRQAVARRSKRARARSASGGVARSC